MVMDMDLVAHQQVTNRLVNMVVVAELGQQVASLKPQVALA
jgi:hypothetical protein